LPRTWVVSYIVLGSRRSPRRSYYREARMD
jgi:hypothetical protein